MLCYYTSITFTGLCGRILSDTRFTLFSQSLSSMLILPTRVIVPVSSDISSDVLRYPQS